MKEGRDEELMKEKKGREEADNRGIYFGRDQVKETK